MMLLKSYLSQAPSDTRFELRVRMPSLRPPATIHGYPWYLCLLFTNVHDSGCVDIGIERSCIAPLDAPTNATIHIYINHGEPYA